MRMQGAFQIVVFVCNHLTVAGCVQSRSGSNCAGWRQNNVSSSGLVALIKIDRSAAESVEGSEQNGQRFGCW